MVARGWEVKGWGLRGVTVSRAQHFHWRWRRSPGGGWQWRLHSHVMSLNLDASKWLEVVDFVFHIFYYNKNPFVYIFLIWLSLKVDPMRQGLKSRWFVWDPKKCWWVGKRGKGEKPTEVTCVTKPVITTSNWDLISWELGIHCNTNLRANSLGGEGMEYCSLSSHQSFLRAASQMSKPLEPGATESTAVSR